MPGRFSLAVPLLLGTLFAVPLLINPGAFSSFDETYLSPRLWLIYAIVLPCALLLLGHFRVSWQLPRMLLALLGGFLLWLTLSVLVTGAGWPGWWGQTDRADGVLMHAVYILLALCGWRLGTADPEWRPKFSAALLIGGGLLALTNIAQQLHLAGIANEYALSGVAATPFGGTLGNRGYMGGALALLLPGSLWAMSYVPARYQRAAQLAVMLVAWGWLGAFTRGAWLAGALGLGWVAYFGRPSRQVWFPVLAGILAFAIVTPLYDNARQLSLDSSGGQELTDNSGRTVLWNSALYGIKHKPVFGWGTPALHRVMSVRPPLDLLRENGNLNVTGYRVVQQNSRSAPIFLVTYQGGKKERVMINNVDKVHNEYLDYALTYGLPAALLFVTLLGWAVWSGRTAAPGLSAGLIGYALFLCTWPEIIRFAPIAWFMLGLSLAAGARQNQPGIVQDHVDPQGIEHPA